MGNRARVLLAKFAADQRGAETMHVLVITAIAGVCLILVKLWWSSWVASMTHAIQQFLEN